MNHSATPKLNKEQKSEVRAMRREFEENGGAVFHFPEQRVTVAVQEFHPGSKFVRVSVAHCADHEPKFRKSIGTMVAIAAMMSYDRAILVRIGACESLEDVATNVAELMAH